MRQFWVILRHCDTLRGLSEAKKDNDLGHILSPLFTLFLHLQSVYLSIQKKALYSKKRRRLGCKVIPMVLWWNHKSFANNTTEELPAAWFFTAKFSLSLGRAAFGLFSSEQSPVVSALQ